MAQAKERKADKSFRLGRIWTSIWKNFTDEGRVWFNVKIARRYQDGGKWEEATTYGLGDLPIVILAAVMAYNWCWTQKMPANPVQSNTDGNGEAESRDSDNQGGEGHDDASDF